MSVIFLAGVHGVGKGFLGTLVANLLEISHLTASQLIREEKGQTSWGVDKRVAELDDNQIALICAVARRRKADRDILLDGHFVLRNSAGKLIQLPKDVFSDLKLSAVILLTEDSEIIAKRLLDRDGLVVSAESILELASEESTHANEVCQRLEIPIFILHKPDVPTLTELVIRLTEKPI
jgi:adenylate kinase